MKNTLFILIFCLFGLSLAAQQPNPEIKDVRIIFKTHLDIGYTDLQSKVVKTYVREFIPKALDVADELKNSGAKERYIWTTGSWLIYTFLDQATKPQADRLIKAIEAGDIVWNAMPYTIESESMNRPMFENIMLLTNELDKRFGKKTTGGKMTDVPGHTRGIIPVLQNAGVKLLHIGVNGMSYVPKVPPICRWRDPSGSEIILMYQGEYGEDMILPDGKTVMSVVFTGDNHGPHTIAEVKKIYADLRIKYPNATLNASNFSEIATLVEPFRSTFPVVTQEIGDTWIHGYMSAPMRMARYREVQRLYTQWVKTGKLNPSSDEAMRFALRIGFIPEHTWGVSNGIFFRNFDAYDYDSFQRALKTAEFKHAELSWLEVDENVNVALSYLPKELQQEAEAALRPIENPQPQTIVGSNRPKDLTLKGELKTTLANQPITLGKVTFNSYSAQDYKNYQTQYMRSEQQHRSASFHKPKLEKSPAKRATLEAEVKAVSEVTKEGVRKINALLAFPNDPRVDARLLPESIYANYSINSSKNSIDYSLTLYNKPANRMPEDYFVTFTPEQITKIVVEKMGQEVDVMDVVEGGNRQMHGIDNYVEFTTKNGRIRITSMDAMIATLGKCETLYFTTEQPDLSKGVHFNLFNNWWCTNFNLWWAGSITYRFKIEFFAK